MVRFAYLGTPPFAAGVLQNLVQRGHSPTLIVTQPDRPGSSRRTLLGSAVFDWARVHAPQIPLLRPYSVSSGDFLPEITSREIDLLIVAAYGQILRPSLLDLLPLGALNAHASLLPKWRGAAPIQRAILAGDSQTGVTLMRIAPALDAGDVIASSTCPIASDVTAGELEEQLCPLASQLFSWALESLGSGRTLPQTPQIDAHATYAAKLTSDEGHISWMESAAQTHRRIRAVTPRPGAWCNLRLTSGLRRVNLGESRPLSNATLSETLDREGRIGLANSRICFRCAEGLVGVGRLQVEGGRWLNPSEFKSGYQSRLIGPIPSQNGVLKSS